MQKIKLEKKLYFVKYFLKLYLGRDLNPHDRNGHGILSPACLPIPPPRHHDKYLSGKRDSNSRPRPWQGRALPTELFPHLIRELQKYNFFYYNSQTIGFFYKSISKSLHYNEIKNYSKLISISGVTFTPSYRISTPIRYVVVNKIFPSISY